MRNYGFIALSMLITLSAACGKVEHEVTGDADINFNFNLKEIESYFLALCHSINDPNPTECAKAKTAEFLQYIISIQQQQKQRGSHE